MNSPSVQGNKPNQHNHNHHHQSTLLAILQNSTPASSLSFSCSTNSGYNHSNVSLTGASNLLSGKVCASNNFNFQPQCSTFMGPFQNQQVSMVGGEVASCSSSDRSCNKNQATHVKETEFVCGKDGTFTQQAGGAHNYYLNNGFWGESLLDFGMEDIKQLAHTDSCSNLYFL